MEGRITFLGTGGSVGSPMIGCTCPVCTSNDTRNQRLRSSILVQFDGITLVVDTGPDFRIQALKYNIHKLDGLLLTHAHYDHTAGLDDIRPLLFRRGEPLPALFSKSTLEDLEKRFYYFLEAKPQKLAIHLLEGDQGEGVFQKLHYSFFTYQQAGMEVTGFRFGDIAYVTDIRDYPDSIFDDLKGVQTLILGALRFTQSPVHFTIDEGVAFAEKVNAKQTYFTHISHEVDHAQAEALLPSHIHLAYDGLQLTFNAQEAP